MSGVIERFTSDFHEHFTRDPNSCLALGVDRRRDELPDPSNEEAGACVTEARGLLDALEGIDGARIDFDTALDLDLARLMLESQIHEFTYEFNGRTERQQTPAAGETIGGGLFKLFANDPRPDDERLADVTGRMEMVPAFLDAMLARLDTPVQRWVDIDVEEVDGLPSFFETLRNWAELSEFADIERLSRATKEATAALETYVARLQTLPTTTHLHIGDTHARRLVELRGIDLSLEQLHEHATAFLVGTRVTLEELRIRLNAKYELEPATSIDDLHAFLNRRYAVDLGDSGLDAILARYQRERGRILDFIAERDLFPVFDEQDMLLVRTPDFMVPSIPAGAMMSPPPFREGIRKSVVYLTLTDNRVDEHTELGIPGMMIHEGIPGHHLQLATASRHRSIVRRHFEAYEHSEGWTTMLEDYMLDVGYMGDLEDEGRFYGKRGINRLGARVAIDLFFMTGSRDYLDVGVECDLTSEDPFEAAGNVLAAVTGFTPARVQGELNWYSMARGYPLSYLTGNKLVHELKRDVVAAGARRTPPLTGLDLDRSFHRIYLESGNMPVSYLRKVFEREGLV